MVTIDLTDKEAESFKNWREYQDKFETLVEAGVFTIKGAPVTIHFDDKSNIRKIESLVVRIYTVTNLT